MMPAVAVFSNPSGLPMAIAISPGRGQLAAVLGHREFAALGADDREVGHVVGGQHLSAGGDAVGEADGHLPGVTDHVRVGDDDVGT